MAECKGPGFDPKKKNADVSPSFPEHSREAGKGSTEEQSLQDRLVVA